MLELLKYIQTEWQILSRAPFICFIIILLSLSIGFKTSDLLNDRENRAIKEQLKLSKAKNLENREKITKFQKNYFFKQLTNNQIKPIEQNESVLKKQDDFIAFEALGNSQIHIIGGSMELGAKQVAKSSDEAKIKMENTNIYD